MSLKGKTLFITGASRGIGKAIALKAAADGANIVIAAKTAEPDPRLDGTIFTAAEEIEAAGGNALPLVLDIRDDAAVHGAVEKAADHFGGIDILINNASAIYLAGVAHTPPKKFDLMHQINTRGTYVCTHACLPHLKRADNPHVLMISPPLNFEEKWFAPHTAYSIAKFGMSLCVLGMAGEFRTLGIGVNALWPRTAIATAAVKNILGGDMVMRMSRKPEIMADAAWHILTSPASVCTGNYFVDDEVMASAGVTDLSHYAVDPTQKLAPDFFVDPVE